MNTGAVRWRHAGAVAAEPWKTVAGRASGRWEPFQVGSRWALLDRVTGATAAAPPGAVLACVGHRSSLAAPNPNDGGRPGGYAAGTFLQACGGRAALSRFAVTSGGIGGGSGWWVVAAEHQLTGYHFDT